MSCQCINICDTMGSIHFCYGTKPTQRAWAWDWKWRRKGRSQRRQSQLIKGGKREQSAWDSCPEKDTVGRKRHWEDGSRAEKTVKRWVSIPSGFVEVSHKYSPAIAYKCMESCTKGSHRLPPSCTWSWPKPVFVHLFFSSTLLVVFCVSIQKCVMPLVGNHLMNHWPLVVWFKEAKIVGVGQPGVLSHISFSRLQNIYISLLSYTSDF